MTPKTNRIWALYVDDIHVCDGTPREIAKLTKKSLRSILWLTTPAARKRKSSIVMVDLGDYDGIPSGIQTGIVYYCKNCGKMFNPTTLHQKICSDKCSYEESYRRKKERNEK